MRGHAKLLIEQTLARLPLEEIGVEEACEVSAAIRDRLYASAFTRQAREAERQRIDTAAHKKKELETVGALFRADRRKKMLRHQASQRAEAFCQEKKITGWTYVSILSDVESRLEVFLSGEEPILEAQAIVRSVLEDRFAEAEATLTAAQATAAAQWRREMEAALVLATVAGLVGLSLRYPEQMVAFFNWVERIYDFAPGAEAGAPDPEASETTSSTASAVAPSDSEFPFSSSGIVMQGQA